MSMDGPGPFFSLFPLHLQKVYFENDHHPATAPQIETHGAFQMSEPTINVLIHVVTVRIIDLILPTVATK